MPEIANHTIVVGEGADAKTIAAGETLPKLPPDEIKRLRDIGAIGNQLPSNVAIPVGDDDRARTLVDEGVARSVGTDTLPSKVASAPPARKA